MLTFKTFPLWIKAISLILCFNLLALPVLAQAAENSAINQDQQQELDYARICAQAEADAEKDEGGAIAFGIGGFLCGVIGFLIAYASTPKAPAERLVGKDPNYVQAYSTCYEKKAKSIRTKAACTGWSMAVLVGVIYVAASGGFSAETTEY